MHRKIEGANLNMIIRLLTNINYGIQSMIKDYNYLYKNDEIEIFNNIIKKIDDMIVKVKDNNYNNKELYKILDFEDYLKPFVFRCWNYEINNGYKIVSWFKRDKIKDIPSVVSSTFGTDESFCESRYGISFKILIDGFLGACSKDAATILEEKSKASIYTIGCLPDGRVINSYNLATPIITPVQVRNTSFNDYMSKHNEVILDSRFIKPISVVYTSENDRIMVDMISKKYNIPIEYEHDVKKRK